MECICNIKLLRCGGREVAGQNHERTVAGIEIFSIFWLTNPKLLLLLMLPLQWHTAGGFAVLLPDGKSRNLWFIEIENRIKA